MIFQKGQDTVFSVAQMRGVGPEHLDQRHEFDISSSMCQSPAPYTITYEEKSTSKKPAQDDESDYLNTICPTHQTFFRQYLYYRCQFVQAYESKVKERGISHHRSGHDKNLCCRSSDKSGNPQNIPRKRANAYLCLWEQPLNFHILFRIHNCSFKTFSI